MKINHVLALNGADKLHRWASVHNIVEDAKAKDNGFRGWVDPKANRLWYQRVLRAALVVLFDSAHVETVRKIFPRLRLVLTDGGNTSSGNSGSQDNGGCVALRSRDWSASGFPARGVAPPPWPR